MELDFGMYVEGINGVELPRTNGYLSQWTRASVVLFPLFFHFRSYHFCHCCVENGRARLPAREDVAEVMLRSPRRIVRLDDEPKKIPYVSFPPSALSDFRVGCGSVGKPNSRACLTFQTFLQ